MMHRDITIRPLAAADAPACDDIIRSLPYHFGNEDGRQECARAVRSCDGLVAARGDVVVAFLTVERHFERSAEITWMAVQAESRGQGIGRALVERLCDALHDEGRQVLLVMTLGPSYDEGDVEDGYERTRAFYRSVGFLPAREWPDFWPTNPALLLVKVLRA
jgi:GNAT superfamily N-acetyltransferase